MLKYKLFGAAIQPACEYCELGQSAGDHMVLCPNKGVVAPFFKCRRFVYSPLKRVPHRPLALPVYSEDEFKL